MMHAMQDVTVGQISLIWEEKRLGSWMHYAWWMLAGVITTWYEFIIRPLKSYHTTQYWWANSILYLLNWFRRRVHLVRWKRTHFVAIPLPLVIHARTLIATQMEIASQKRLKDWLKLWQKNHDMEWKFWKHLTTSFVFEFSNFYFYGKFCKCSRLDFYSWYWMKCLYNYCILSPILKRYNWNSLLILIS